MVEGPEAAVLRLRDQAHNLGSAFTPLLGAPEYPDPRVLSMLADPILRAEHINAIRNTVVGRRYEGVDINYEGLGDADPQLLITFAQELASALGECGKLLAVTVEPKVSDSERPGFDYAGIAQHVDELRVMCYDNFNATVPLTHVSEQYHSAPSWVVGIIFYALGSGVDAGVLRLGLPLYGHEDYIQSMTNALWWSYVEETRVEHDAIVLRNHEGIPHFTYDFGLSEIWYEDAESVAEKLDYVNFFGLRGIAFWRIGDQDPDLFPTLDCVLLNPLCLLSPNGGETLCVGHEVVIEWEAQVGLGSPLNIRYSLDGGVNWELVREQAPNTGTYNWVVHPDAVSQEVLLEIQTTDANGFPVKDQSDATFSVSPSSPQRDEFADLSDWKQILLETPPSGDIMLGVADNRNVALLSLPQDAGVPPGPWPAVQIEKPFAGGSYPQDRYWYGTYAARMRSAGCEPHDGAGLEEGVVSGFFTYWAEDPPGDYGTSGSCVSSEIDVELLGHDPAWVYMTIWTAHGDGHCSTVDRSRIATAVNMRTGDCRQKADWDECGDGWWDDPTRTDPRNEWKDVPDPAIEYPEFDHTEDFYVYEFSWQSTEICFYIYYHSEKLLLWRYDNEDHIPTDPAKLVFNVWYSDDWGAISDPHGLNLSPPVTTANHLSVDWVETPSPIAASEQPPDTPAVFRVDVGGGNVYADGDIHSSSLASGSADVAEWVQVSTYLEPGDVVELDPAIPGHYRVSQAACSSLVAGVISTSPGVALGGTLVASSRELLALAGIVPVKVSDEGGPIMPGDLLISSSTPGHAMRWSGPDPCSCSLVGKALEPMTDERGVILVLLTAH